MDANERAALAEAVNTLIEDGGAKQLFAQLNGVLQLTRQGMPVALTGRTAVLNPLLHLGTDDPAAYDRVMDLVESKRRTRALEPLFTPDPDTDRKSYMREFMATKRERQGRLIALLNQLRPEADQIRGPQRMELERVHAARWQDEKDKREKAARTRLERRLTADERKEISNKLWAEVDAELDALEQFVQSEMRKHPTARSKAGFRFLVGQAKGKA